MFKKLLVTALVCSLTASFSQHIFYKRMNRDSLALFNDTTQRVKFVYKDTTDKADYTLYFKYLLRFFPKMEFNRITVTFKPSKRVTKTRPTFWCLFQNPENRNYRMTISTRTNPTLDSVLLKNLSLDAQLGMIASELGTVKDLSTDGFFDLIGWHFKHISRRAVKNLDHDNDIKVLEAGMGYFLLALSVEEEEKLKIEKWHDAKAYAFYFKHYKNHFMNPEGIRNFIRDMPIYVTEKFR